MSAVILRYINRLLLLMHFPVVDDWSGILERSGSHGSHRSPTGMSAMGKIFIKLFVFTNILMALSAETVY